MFRTSYELSSRTVIDSGNPSYDPDQVYDCDMCSDGGWCSETEVEIHKNNKHSRERDAIITDETKHACKVNNLFVYSKYIYSIVFFELSP